MKTSNSVVTISLAVFLTATLNLGPSQATTATISARTLVTQLRVAPEHNYGYQRNFFTLWIDSDHDGCNTREEVLIAEAASTPSRNSACTLTGGKWFSAYDGQVFTSASSLDIDHMVPLEEAWASGAYKWTSATRTAYANDLGYPRSLIAVSAGSNRSKGSDDPWLWMPTRTSYRCQYIDDWVAIKYRWNLAVDTREKQDLVTKLRSCTGRTMVMKPLRATVRMGSSPAGSSSGSSSSNTGTDPRFSSCANAKAAGYGPYFRGRDAEYSWYRDGDSDGIVCE